MKVKTKLSGFDGVNQYEPGATLEGNSEHIQNLIISGAAEPLDKEAKEYAERGPKSSLQKTLANVLKTAVKESTVVSKKKSRKNK